MSPQTPVRHSTHMTAYPITAYHTVLMGHINNYRAEYLDEVVHLNVVWKWKNPGPQSPAESGVPSQVHLQVFSYLCFYMTATTNEALSEQLKSPKTPPTKVTVRLSSCNLATTSIV